jgi:PPOX class probable F420-dependent enzyme
VNAQQARDFVARNTRAVLATIKQDGRPQLSSVAYTLDEDGLIRISVTRDRAKTRNLQRDPRATLQVLSENWYEYLVVEATCAVEDGPTTLADLRRVYERIRGAPHPNWAEFDEAMQREGRALLALTIERMYPLDRG